MKKLLKIAVLLAFTTAASAQADIMIPTSVTGSGPNQFVKRYALNSFNVATASTRLRGLGEIDAGSIEINEGTNELRLHLDRSLRCEANMMCPAVMPTPTEITLRIRHIENNICGGLTFVAERNLALVDGGLVRIEVQDLNGSRCGGSSLLAVQKRVKVIVTEQGSHDREEVISVLSGTILPR